MKLLILLYAIIQPIAVLNAADDPIAYKAKINNESIILFLDDNGKGLFITGYGDQLVEWKKKDNSLIITTKLFGKKDRVEEYKADGNQGYVYKDSEIEIQLEKSDEFKDKIASFREALIERLRRSGVYPTKNNE